MEEVHSVSYKVKEFQISSEELLKKLGLEGEIKEIEFFKAPISNLIIRTVEKFKEE